MQTGTDLGTLGCHGKLKTAHVASLVVQTWVGLTRSPGGLPGQSVGLSWHSCSLWGHRCPCTSSHLRQDFTTCFLGIVSRLTSFSSTWNATQTPNCGLLGTNGLRNTHLSASFPGVLPLASSQRAHGVAWKGPAAAVTRSCACSKTDWAARRSHMLSPQTIWPAKWHRQKTAALSR